MMSTLATILPAMLGDATGPTFWMPEAASSVAGEIDWILEFINIICYVFFGIIVFALVYLAVKYRRDPNRKQISGDGPTHNMALELTWTIIPTLIVLVIFWVGMVGYIDLRESPDDSYEVGVFAQKWQWTFSHPEYGVTEGGELTVPLGRPVRVIMTSADVLHAFFVPAFRVKQDIVPGRYSTLWFEATKPGNYQLYCAEYCGKDHSKMLATVRVLPEDEFQDTMGKLAREYEDLPDADLPRYALVRLYNRCSSCHSLDGSTGTAPSFKGLWDRTTAGSTVFTDGSTLSDHMNSGGEYEVPENYIRDSIMNPGKYVVENFTNVMPNNFAAQLKPRQIEALILMMKHLDKLVDEDGNIIEPPETEEPKASARAGTAGEGG